MSTDKAAYPINAMVQKSPVSIVGDLAQAVKELFNADVDIKVIGTRHGENTGGIYI